MKMTLILFALASAFTGPAFASAADAAYSLGYSAAPGLPYGPVYRTPAPAADCDQAPVRFRHRRHR